MPADLPLIHHYLYQHARDTPDQPALLFDQQQLSYAELASRAAALAQWLHQHGVQAGDRVGIHLPKGIDSVVALYGILSAGAVYVPLDPSAPPARTAFAIRDCGIRCLIGNGSGDDALQAVIAAGTGLRDILGSEAGTDPDSDPSGNPHSNRNNAQTDRDGIRHHPWSAASPAATNTPAAATAPACTAQPDDLAYLIYTSGSTGQPKGIMHTHRSGLAFAHWAVDSYQLNSNDRLTSQAPLHFDMSIFDLFGTLLAGASAIIIPDVIMRLPAAYAGLLAKQHASVLFTVPFVLSQLLLRGALQNHDLSALRWMVFGGDNHSPEHIRQLMQALPHTRFSHMYGPAETNGCTYLHLQQPPLDPQLPIPIGQRCPGMQVELRDPDGKPLDQADQIDQADRTTQSDRLISGEIWVSGATLMQGYWNRPDLTQRVLIDQTDASGQPQRWCRTGDLAERLPDGQLRFLGRKDRQVKLRGFRIELEEIETLMLAHPDVEEAAAFIVGDPTSGQRLAACIITAPAQALDTHALLDQLAQSLPRYALPEAIEQKTALPRTASGKIDRLALARAWEEQAGSTVTVRQD